MPPNCRAEISLRWAGAARPLALPMGELARLKAVTERVPGCNQRTNTQICHCKRPLSLATLASSPKGGAKGGCAANAIEPGDRQRRVFTARVTVSPLPAGATRKKIPISLWIFPEKSAIMKCKFNEFWKTTTGGLSWHGPLLSLQLTTNQEDSQCLDFTTTR